MTPRSREHFSFLRAVADSGCPEATITAHVQREGSRLLRGMRKILAKPDIGPFVSNAKQQFRASLHEAHVLADVLLAAQEARDKGIELGPGIDCSGLEKCCLQAARNVMSALRVCKMR